MAQSNVYSLNIVGYVNLTIQPGYNLVANQLDADGTDSVNVALTNGVPDQTQLFGFSGGAFTSAITFQAGGGNQWYDDSFNLATNTIFPNGQAFFLYNVSGAPATITLTGSVLTSTNSSTITPGYNFAAIDFPVAQDLDTNGFPQIDQEQYFTLVNGSYTAAYTYQAGGNGWYDDSFNQVFPTPAVGQGFVIYNPGNTSGTWAQSFSVQ